MKMTYLMMRLEWKVFISSKPCRLIVVPRQEFIKHMFGKLLFFFVFPKLGISYKVKKGRMDSTFSAVQSSLNTFTNSALNRWQIGGKPPIPKPSNDLKTLILCGLSNRLSLYWPSPETDPPPQPSPLHTHSPKTPPNPSPD